MVADADDFKRYVEEISMGEWFCTDTDSFQYCKEYGNGKYDFIEIV